MGATVQLAYLGAAVLFIVGLKGLTRPRTAVRGNVLGAAGMLIAVLAVLIDDAVVDYVGLAAGLALGGLAGALLAVRVRMTAMPQLVALFNGFGGLASALVTAAEYMTIYRSPGSQPLSAHAAQSIAMGLAALVGAVTFTGSVIAYLKLEERLGSVRIPAARLVNGLLLGLCIGFICILVLEPSSVPFTLLLVVASVLGVTLVVPIGGADMPVVIALLNSYSGLAAAAAGFALSNTALVVSGSLVGASGIILTSIMCTAMNRSLMSVLFGQGAGQRATSPSEADVYGGNIKSTSVEEVAMLLESAARVVMVPGYGMAVAQAQHAVRELMKRLEARGAQVQFAIHPVAGRMPGHMNVLLAEADIPYEALVEMEEINPSFEQVDVAIVIGANDVVNPAARDQPSCPIAGMPILNVDKARTVVVLKRGLSPGFAGIPNPLFAAPNALMLFADGKQAVSEIASALAGS